ncbi:MAG: T9SS type A sorting domain-containing protein [Bacteroidetes bacterium]|nr:T9SS type A sorting domain-containing protein [Bacteroidota bacterium]
MKILSIVFLLFITIFSFAQYPPAAGLPGSTAIFADSSIIVNWAKSCKVQRGFVDISSNSDSLVSNGFENDAIGKADNITVSLGDSGSAVLTFNPPLTNGNGFDFAVFENSFDGAFIELAFVEVSSDSINWFRFPSESVTQVDSQVTTFGILEPTKINNLAGKYKALFGTPFDLQELNGKPFLNIDSVTFVRIVDVIGSISDNYATYDSDGNKINDPFPTPFYTSGFDLDAIGVINEKTQNIYNNKLNNVSIYPNPVKDFVNIYFKGFCNFEIIDIYGKKLVTGSFFNHINIFTNELQPGVYVLKVYFENKYFTSNIIKY